MKNLILWSGSFFVETFIREGQFRARKNAREGRFELLLFIFWRIVSEE